MKEVEIKQIEVELEVKMVDGEENVFEGYASTFGNLDWYGDRVQKGAFSKTISVTCT